MYWTLFILTWRQLKQKIAFQKVKIIDEGKSLIFRRARKEAMTRRRRFARTIAKSGTSSHNTSAVDNREAPPMRAKTARQRTRDQVRLRGSAAPAG